MTFSFPVPDQDDPAWTAANAIIVPADGGKTVTLNGDVFTVKLRAAISTGSMGFIEIDVPPGLITPPHTHGTEDESFYLVSGEVEFVNGNTTARAHAGDFVFIPRGTRHGYTNVGAEVAKMLVFFTPGGAEEFWVETGKEPTPESVGVSWPMEKFSTIADAMERYNMTMYLAEHAPAPDGPAEDNA